VTAAFAISGVSIGTFASMIYCLVSKGVLSPKATTESNIRRSSVLKKLVSIALPITVSSSVMGLMNVIDTVIAPSRLQDIGYTATQATEIYGNYTTLAVSLFNMPTVLVYPIAYAVVPKLTEILTLGKDGRGLITSSIKTTSVISLPCAVGLGVLSLPILDLIFPENSALLASPMLTMLAPSVFFCAVLGITNSIL
jgi:stage V sporulation protein B